jgi:hypothetical protein
MEGLKVVIVIAKYHRVVQGLASASLFPKNKQTPPKALKID